MDQTIFGFLGGSRKSGLCLIDWPTGRGKTTQAEEYICNHAGERNIFYATPLKKNVGEAYRDTLKRFKDKDRFKRIAILLPSNLDSVKANLGKVKDLLPEEITREKVFIDLWNSVSGLCMVESRDKRSVPPELQDTAAKAESAFRRWLTGYVCKNLGRTARERLASIRADEKLRHLIELYPAIESCEKSVFFMTTDKFYMNNSTIVEPSYSFLDSDITKGALVFLDEFDACKDAILNHQIEEAAKNAVGNVFGLIKKIGDSFDSPMTEDFYAGEPESNGHNAAYVYQEIKKKFHDEAREKRLNVTFKYRGEQDAPKSFIFKDTDHITILEQKKSDGKFLALDESKPTLNYIYKADVKDGKKATLNGALMTAQGDIEFFARGIAIAARDLMAHAHDVQHRDLSVTDAIHSCLERFDLSEQEIEYFMPIVLSDFTRKKRKAEGSMSPEFYERGFSFNSMADQDASYLETKIKSVSLSSTPESYLCALASQAYVVGLSATATLHSSTGNFDLNYLQSKLGPAFYQPTPEDKARMAAQIAKQMKDYHPDIRVSFESCGEKAEDKYGLSEVIGDPDAVEFITSKIDNSGSDEDFDKVRFANVYKAALRFLLNRKSKALLVLCNRNMKEQGGGLYSKDRFIEFLNDGLNAIRKKVGFGVLCLDGLVFDERKTQIGLMVEEFGKAIVVSSYPTTGTGQNLQYSEKDGTQKDLDSLYLESPTNLVVDLKHLHEIDQTKATEAILRYCYQVEVASVSGGISPAEKRAYIKYAFQKRINPFAKLEMKDGHLYGCSSTNLYGIRILAQATGRISRTKKKSHEVNIYLDVAISRTFDFRLLDESAFVEEFQAIIRACKKRRVDYKSDSNEERINACLNGCGSLKNVLWSILSETKEEWSDGQIAEWQEMREYLLKHPTLSDEELASSPYAYMYFRAPQGEKFTKYYFAFEDEDITDVRYESPAKGTMAEVSAENARLTLLASNKEFAKAMADRGYPTAFRPDDAILNPVAFTNIYKGALGEFVVEYVLNGYGIAIQGIKENAKFEKFDFALQERPDVYVDAKNWSLSTASGANGTIDAPSLEQKFLGKLAKVGGSKAIVISAFADGNEKPHIEGGGKILVIPTLFDVAKDSCPIAPAGLLAIREFLEEK